MKAVRLRQLAIKGGAQEVHVEPSAEVIFVEGSTTGQYLMNVWLKVEVTDAPLVKRLFRIFYTDQEIPDNFDHVGSGTIPNGRLVHVFESHEPKD